MHQIKNHESFTLSCPSGGTKQTAAMSLTASSMTKGTVGEMDLARSVKASLWSKRFLSPTLLFIIAFKHFMHSSWTRSHFESLKLHKYNETTYHDLINHLTWWRGLGIAWQILRIIEYRMTILTVWLDDFFNWPSLSKEAATDFRFVFIYF